MTVPKRYPGIGQCICCGALEETHRLTDEHIMPDGLRGNQILERASCDSCCKVINRFESRSLRGMLRSARIHSGFRSRKTKERPSTLPLDFVSHENVNPRTSRIDLPISEHPYALSMPSYPPPRILFWLDRQPLHKRFTWCVQPAFQPDFDERFRRLIERLGPIKIRTEIATQHEDFMRMLAKIAHCAAIRRLNDPTFPRLRYLLPDVILGNDKSLAYYIGGNLRCGTPRNAEILETRIAFRNVQRQGRMICFAVVYIDIFGPYGMPRYYVVVGEVI